MMASDSQADLRSVQHAVPVAEPSAAAPTAGYAPASTPGGRGIHEARREWLRVAAILGLVAVGFLIAQVWPAATVGDEAPVGALWRLRPVDLALQVGLMLVGAFGIRALLPGEEE